MPRYKSVSWTYFCDVCESEEEEAMVGDSVEDPNGGYTDEIVRNQATADMALRAQGWKFRRDGTIVGPNCADGRAW